MAPKIDRRNMRDLTLSANSMLKFDVGVIGEPVPTMQWTVGGLPLKYKFNKKYPKHHKNDKYKNATI